MLLLEPGLTYIYIPEGWGKILLPQLNRARAYTKLYYSVQRV